jgi:hypothetical protein
MGCWLRIDTRRIEEVLTRFGAWPTLKLLDYIATNAQRIAAPARYVARILEKESAGVPTLLSETRQRATMARS